MNEILSIDLDFILEPCINLYNDLINNKIPKQKVWNDIEKKRSISRHIQYDLNRLNFIKELFNFNCPYYFGNDHSSIINAIAKNNDLIFPLNIYNIDHHHDIHYNKEQEDDCFLLNIAECGNWVGYLNAHDIINKYYWIRNENSSDFMGDRLTAPVIEELYFNNYTIESLLNKKFSMVYITSSWQFFAPQLEKMLIEIFNELLQKQPNTYLFGNEVSQTGMISFNYLKDEMKIFKKEENKI